MTCEGTVVNGTIVFDDPLPFPEGMRVRVESAGEPFEYPHPLAPYDRDKELAVLRERIGEMKAGVAGVPLQVAMDRIAVRLNLPSVEPESA